MASTALPTFSSIDPDELFVCPYDPVHRISAKRYPYHVRKCRQQHGAGTLVACPFNARHLIPQLEMDYHVASCPDKDVIRQDLEARTGVSRPNRYRPPEGSWVVPEASESWDDEECNPSFIPPSVLNLHRQDFEEPQDNFRELEAVQSIQKEFHETEPQVDLSSMTATQKKNYKRSLKRAEKREGERNGSMENGMRQMPQEEYLERLLEKYPIRSTGSFIDWKSILNQHCQKNRINPPKYREAPGHMGGFGSEVIVQSNVYRSTRQCSTKKDAAQDAALAAILGMNIPVGSDPTPCKPIQARSSHELELLRQTHERQLLKQSANTQQSRQPAAVTRPPVQPAATAAAVIPAVPERTHQGVVNQMQNLTINQNGTQDDGWTTVPKKGNAKQSLKLAGRGRGAPRR